MIPLDLKGKLAVIGGVGDDRGFAWHIAKALNAAGAKLIFATHPRLVNVVSNILERDLDKDSRALPYGAGELKVEKVLPCDVSYDTMADVDEKTLNDKRFAKHGDYSIQGLVNTIAKDHKAVDIFLHAIAFSPEIKNKMIDTSRKAYLQALSISSYSLTALLKALQPMMENRPGGASAIALS